MLWMLLFLSTVLWSYEPLLPDAPGWTCGEDSIGLCQSRTHLFKAQTYSGEAAGVAGNMWHSWWVVQLCENLHTISLCLAEVKCFLTFHPGNPRPLKHLCRLQIRRLMTLKRLNDPRIMNSDLFPPGLRNVLLYKELDLYDQTAEFMM